MFKRIASVNLLVFMEYSLSIERSMRRERQAL